MFSLDANYLNNQSISLVMISGSLRSLGRYQGKQELLIHRRPALIKTLKEIAVVQSAESSNRIEGIEVEQGRLEKILKRNVPPKNRPEAQVVGYRDVLSKIHSQYAEIDINIESILKMHRDILKYTDLQGGQWKTKDNTIEERLPGGEWITRFEPVSASETPFYMNELCARFKELWHSDDVDRLVLVFAFVFDFLCIHPFADGNGRVSRLLTVLLLYKLDVDVARYVSYERLIEDSKESYYEILRDVSKGWHRGQHRLGPWLEYNVGLLIAAYKELEERIELIDDKKGSKTAWVLEAIHQQLPDEFSIGELARRCPGISRPMVRHILESLRAEGRLQSIGKGRSAKWKKIGNFQPKE